MMQSRKARAYNRKIMLMGREVSPPVLNMDDESSPSYSDGMEIY